MSAKQPITAADLLRGLQVYSQAVEFRVTTDSPGVFAVERNVCDPQQCEFTGLGTGYYINADAFLPGESSTRFRIGVTNHHVVEGGNRYFCVKFGGKKRVEATVIASDPRRDLAVLLMDEAAEGNFRFNLANEISGAGARVWVYGFPLGRGRGLGNVRSSQGTLMAAPEKDEQGVFTRDMDAEVSPGNSGGPVVNAAGEVVATTVRIYLPGGGRPGGVNAGICVQELRSLLGEVGLESAMSFQLLPGLSLATTPGGVIVRVKRPSAVAGTLVAAERVRSTGVISGLIDLFCGSTWRCQRRIKRRQNTAKSEPHVLVAVDGGPIDSAVQAFDALKGRKKARLTFRRGVNETNVDYLPLSVSANIDW